MILPLFISTTGVASDGTEFVKSWVLNWDKVAQAKWFALPKLMPVKPVFDLRAILPVLIMFVVTAVETVGDISGVMEGGMSREATDQELSGGVICDGIGSSIAALFGVLPNTSFSQNVGLVTMTKIVNRFALACGAIFLIICGLFPKLAALVSIMPQSVLGGAAVIMFSSIVMSGVQLITKEPLTARSMTIVSVALGLGYGIGANSAIFSATSTSYSNDLWRIRNCTCCFCSNYFKYFITKRKTIKEGFLCYQLEIMCDLKQLRKLMNMQKNR